MASLAKGLRGSQQPSKSGATDVPVSFGSKVEYLPGDTKVQNGVAASPVPLSIVARDGAGLRHVNLADGRRGIVESWEEEARRLRPLVHGPAESTMRILSEVIADRNKIEADRDRLEEEVERLRSPSDKDAPIYCTDEEIARVLGKLAARFSSSDLRRFASEASRYADIYLGTRARLPIQRWGGALATLTATIAAFRAVCSIHGICGPDISSSIVRQYNEAIGILRDYARGDVDLTLDQAPPSGSGKADVHFHVTTSGLTAGTMAEALEKIFRRQMADAREAELDKVARAVVFADEFREARGQSGLDGVADVDAAAKEAERAVEVLGEHGALRAAAWLALADRQS
jgi:phage gp36-like protein